MAKSLKAFLSYSHRDEHALERFRKHLAMLKRDGSIATWFDHKLLPGGDIDAEISEHLDETPPTSSFLLVKRRFSPTPKLLL